MLPPSRPLDTAILLVTFTSTCSVAGRHLQHSAADCAWCAETWASCLHEPRPSESFQYPDCVAVCRVYEAGSYITCRCHVHSLSAGQGCAHSPGLDVCCTQRCTGVQRRHGGSRASLIASRDAPPAANRLGSMSLRRREKVGNKPSLVKYIGDLDATSSGAQHPSLL